MKRHDRTEVLVVGAGPVGMFTALRLARGGTRVQVIDLASNTAARSYACALHPGTLQLLDELDIARDAVQLGRLVSKVAFYEGSERRAEADLSRLPGKFPFVLVLEQKEFEGLLERKLREQAAVKVDWHHRLADLTMEGDLVVASVHELAMSAKGYDVPHFELEVKRMDSVRAEFVVGADGQRSIVRQRLGGDYRSVGEPELFVVYEFEAGERLDPEMRIVLEQDQASVLWPLGETTGRWSFQWLPADAPVDFPDKDRDSFATVETPGPDDSGHHLLRLLSERAPWFDTEIERVNWATDIQFEHRMANPFGRGRVWLAGDAAHQTSPVAMQSMNCGFREGAGLADRLNAILRDNAPTATLDHYDRDCQLEWERLLGLTSEPIAGPDADEWVRQRSARLPACLPASGSDLDLLLSQLNLSLQPPLPSS